MSYFLARRVQPEALDALEAHAPAAQRSRRDLQRLHRVMGTLPIMLGALSRAGMKDRPLRILEIGAGDGSFALRLANAPGMHTAPVSLTLLDRQSAVDDETLVGLKARGWSPTVAVADVFDWFSQEQAGQWDIVIANLFVHHFQGDELRRLMDSISRCTSTFFCCEPRRSALALLGSHLVGLLGAGPVTREDAVLSVHAGFRARELTSAWPHGSGWHLREYSAGLFSHCLLAHKQ